MSNDEGDLPKMVAMLIYSMPKFAFGMGVAYLKMRIDAKRAGRDFYLELRKGGIPKEAARALTEQYVSTLSVRRILKDAGGMDLFDRSSW